MAEFPGIYARTGNDVDTGVSEHERDTAASSACAIVACSECGRRGRGCVDVDAHSVGRQIRRLNSRVSD